MLQQSLMYLFFSILVVILKKYAKLLLLYIDIIFTHISVQLSPLLSSIGLGNPIQKILLLALIPVAITGIPGIIYYLFSRKAMPYYFEITWCIWLVIVLSNLLIK